jgi:hypothetical protein
MSKIKMSSLCTCQKVTLEGLNQRVVKSLQVVLFLCTYIVVLFILLLLLFFPLDFLTFFLTLSNLGILNLKSMVLVLLELM